MELNKPTGLPYKVLDKVSRSMYGGGLIFLVAMMFLTAADVILRYIFKNPITGGMEITELMMAMLAGLVFAYAGLHKEHIAIDVLINRFSPRTRAVIETINSVISLGLLAIIIWRTIAYAESLRLTNRTTIYLHIPIWPFIYLLAAGMTVFCLVVIYNTSQHLTQVLSGSRRWVAAILLGVIVLVLALFAAPAFSEGWDWKMSPATTGIFGLILLVALLFSGMPIGIVMVLIGFLGIIYLTGMESGLSTIGIAPYTTVASFTLSVIPLFVLMGNFCAHSGMVGKLFDAAFKWLGRLPGGLAMATMGAAAGFSVVSGSQLATVAVMGAVALPEMRRYKYNPGLAAACIAAAGGLDIMIPPSIVLVIYGILAEESIGKLFLAGFIPGIVQTILFIGTIWFICWRNPTLGPRGTSSRWVEKFTSLKGTWVVMALFIVVIGGLYFGIFTPMEAAGIGAFGAFLFALLTRQLSRDSFVDSLVGTGKVTAMVFLLIIGALLFARFVALTRLPFEAAEFITSLQLNRYVIMSVILAVYLIMGFFMDIMILIIITIPIFVPIVTALGFSPIWFGIVAVLVVATGAITPPFAVNVFVIGGMAKDIPMSSIFRWVFPFVIANIILLVLLVAFPQIALFLPDLMK